VIAAELLRKAMAAYAQGLSKELAALVHPEAEIQMLFLAGDVARGPAGLSDALDRASRSAHKVAMTGIEALDDDAAVVYGTVRLPIPEHGLAYRNAAWLGIVRDGLLWRVTAHPDLDAARQAYLSRTAVPS
jgi:hypothetical protein